VFINNSDFCVVLSLSTEEREEMGVEEAGGHMGARVGGDFHAMLCLRLSHWTILRLQIKWSVLI
jgi:hypothetical protein